MFRVIVLSGILGVMAALTMPAQAVAKEAGDFIMRLRGISFMTDTEGTTDALGGSANTSNDQVPEIDFSYFLTDHIALELIAATTKHRVSVQNSSAGHLDLGTVRTLPPVLTLQYHFQPQSDLSPYIGAGVHYLITFDEEKGNSVNDVSYSNEPGIAFQAGVDYRLTDRLSLNFDVKKVFVSTDIKVNGGSINAKGTNLDPWVVGFGVGYKF